MHVSIFSMALSLAQWKRLALASWYLGSLYARFDECSRKITRPIGRYDVVSYVDSNFLQLFMWERFRVLLPKPREFKAPTPQLVGRDNKDL